MADRYNDPKITDLATRLGRPLPLSPLSTGDGGGTSDDMEARVAKLEAHVEHILTDVSLMKADVGVLKTDMATLKEKVANLPTKEYIVKIVVGTGAVLALLTTFAPLVQRLFGLVR